MQLQKLVRPLRTLQCNTPSPQSVESIYSYDNNGEPTILQVIVFFYILWYNEKITFFHKHSKMELTLIGFAMVQSLEFKSITEKKRIILYKNIIGF